MRQSNFSIPWQNKAALTISATVYDRRALDCTDVLPLVNSLSHLAYLTTVSARTREMLTTDGGIERLLDIVKEGAGFSKKTSSFLNHVLWQLSLQCTVNIGIRGSEKVRQKIIKAGVIPIIVTILDDFLNMLEICAPATARNKLRVMPSISMDRQRYSSALRPLVSTPSNIERQALLLENSSTSLWHSNQDSPMHDSVIVSGISTPMSSSQSLNSRLNTMIETSQSTVDGDHADLVTPLGNSSDTSSNIHQASSSSRQSYSTINNGSQSDLHLPLSRMSVPATYEQVLSSYYATGNQNSTTENHQFYSSDRESQNIEAQIAASDTLRHRSDAASDADFSGERPENRPETPARAISDENAVHNTASNPTPYASLFREIDPGRVVPYDFSAVSNTYSSLNMSTMSIPFQSLIINGPREEDVLCCLQVLAYISKYPYLRDYFSNSEDCQTLRVSKSGDYHRRYNVFELVEHFTVRIHPAEFQYWAGIIMRNSCRKDKTRGGIRQCANLECGKWEEYNRQFAKCRRCRLTKYCSKLCQSKAWAGHRWWCRERHSYDS